MRFLLAALLLAAAALPALADPPSDPLNWLCGPVAPQCFAWDLDDRGLSRYPFDAVDDYQSGVPFQWWTSLGRQFTEGSRAATHLTAGLRHQGRLGGEFEWSHFQSGALHSVKRPDLISLRSTADLSNGDDLMLEYGFGMSVLWADRTYAGLGFSLSAEKRLSKPFTLYARWQPGLLAHTSLVDDLSAGIGASWRYVGAEAGYRALINGLGNEYGPEVSLRVSF